MNSQLINCKTCGKEMAKNAKVCPSCGAKNKKPIYKKWWFWVIIVILLIIIIPAIGGDNEPTLSSTTPSSANPTLDADATTADVPEETTVSEPASVEEFKIGDSVEYKDIRLTVTRTEISNGSDYNKPDEGKEFIHIYLKIENIGDGKLDVGPLDYKIQTSNGQLLGYDLAAAIDVEENQLDSLELMKGGSVEGIIGFSVPTDDNGLILHYYNNYFSEDAAIMINLN